MAGAALREPGRCLWSTVSAGPRTFLRGRCSTRCTGCCFCVAGAALREPGHCNCGQRSPRDRAPFCLAGAALGAPDAAFAWQVQHLESLGAACGQRPPRDRAPFCVAGAALGAPDAAFAWQVQHLESLGAACGQRSPRDRAPFCVAGAALREPGRCLWSTASAGPRTFLRGRCST